MTLRPLAFAAAISLVTLATVHSLAENAKSDISIISDYVISHKHWSPNVFRIERKECDCAFALYYIIYVPELKNAVPRGGKSFAVHYDEQRHRVVKEAQFR
jgi:hypothetical protein